MSSGWQRNKTILMKIISLKKKLFYYLNKSDISKATNFERKYAWKTIAIIYFNMKLSSNESEILL